jgi:4-amino-4-deoxy-L-arabinose transferase-like glycosyltransferase
LIGLSRALTGFEEIRLPVDWNWSADWEANSEAGALPASDLLTVARLPATMLTVLVPLLLFDTGRRMNLPLTGLLAGLLFAFSGLALLHGRRAMSEGPLLFCEVFVVWMAIRLIQTDHGESPEPNLPRRLVQPLGLGLAVALAGSAKLTGWALVPVAVTAVVLAHQSRGWSRAGQLGVLLATAVVCAWLLNPALWSAPAAGLREMLRARQTLTAAQVGAMEQAGPGLLLDDPGEKLLAEFYHAYLAPLAFWDIPNYADETLAAERAYMENGLNPALRFDSAGPRLAAGAMLAASATAGVVFAIFGAIRAIRQRDGFWAVRPMMIVAIWTLAVVAALLAFNIAWQRYYVMLLPLVCIWAGYGLNRLAAPMLARLGQASGSRSS